MVRWKGLWRDQKQSTEPEVNEFIEQNSRFITIGINNGLKPKIGVNTVKHGYDNIEGFLTAVGKPSSRRILNANVLNAQTRKQVKFTTSFNNWKIWMHLRPNIQD